LQYGDESSLTALWKALVSISLHDFDKIYSRLGIEFDQSWYVGESFYQDKINDAIEDLGVYVTRSTSDDSVLLFTELPQAKVHGSKNEEGEIPLILRKSDGAIGYDATDVAAIQYRLIDLNAERLIYVTDSGQSLHFQLVFEAARMVGWAEEGVHSLVHVPFGIVKKSGGGGRIKTREGNAESLNSLLDKAIDRMKRIFIGKSDSREWSAEEMMILDELSRFVGIVCVIFAELKTNRNLDYEFSVDRMCNPDGDSAVFVLHVLEKMRRLLQIEDNNNNNDDWNASGASSKERSLAMTISKFHDVVEACNNSQSPHIICSHILAISSAVSSFMEDPNESLELHSNNRARHRRTLLCSAQHVLIQELKLLGLGIGFFKQMQSTLQIVGDWKHVRVV